MTLFGGHSPQFDLATQPDCMTAWVYEDLLWGYNVEDAEDQTATPEGQFAWFALFTNHMVVREVAIV